MSSVKKIIAFDLDGTLTESRTPMDDEMTGLFSKLIEKYKVAIISGGLFSQFKKQILDSFSKNLDLYNLVLLPANGTSFYAFSEDKWKVLHEDKLTEKEKEKIFKVCKEVLKETGLEKEFIEKKGEVTDKKGQMTLAIYNPDWPLLEKMSFDPDWTKREPIRKLIQNKLPNYEIRIGGTTSIDVTPKGKDKGFAMNEVLKYWNIPKEEALFIGDAIFPGGNDYAASKIVSATSVSNPEDTKKIIKSLL